MGWFLSMLDSLSTAGVVLACNKGSPLRHSAIDGQGHMDQQPLSIRRVTFQGECEVSSVFSIQECESSLTSGL